VLTIVSLLALRGGVESTMVFFTPE
jgi:hypothetical protein